MFYEVNFVLGFRSTILSGSYLFTFSKLNSFPYKPFTRNYLKMKSFSCTISSQSGFDSSKMSNQHQNGINKANCVMYSIGHFSPPWPWMV